MYYQIDIKYQNIDIAKVTKVIRTLSPSLKLKDAEEISTYISNHKCTLVAGISFEVATHIQTTFTEINMQVQVNESSIESPMVLLPKAEAKWQWGSFCTIQKAI